MNYDYEKIDELIIKEILNWRIRGECWVSQRECLTNSLPDDLILPNSKETTTIHTVRCHKTGWCPTHNLIQAYEVIEELTERGHVFSINSCYCEEEKTTLYHGVTWKNEFELVMGRETDHPALAICLCILKAFDIPIPTMQEKEFLDCECL